MQAKASKAGGLRHCGLATVTPAARQHLPAALDSLELILVDVVKPLAAALILGGAVGFERMRKDRPAGFRTYMLVSLGAASFVLLAVRVFEMAAGVSSPDPIRMIEGVATGIGFLGAGSIIRSGENVRGVTTAAGIWAAGSLGAACGLQYYDVAIVIALLMLLVLYPLERLEEWLQANAISGDS